MRDRRPRPEQRDVVAHRLAQLTGELEAARDEAVRQALHEPASEAPEALAAGAEWWDDHTRIAAVRTPLRVVGDPAEEHPPETSLPRPVHVPQPGRHAARRPLDLLGALVPETLRGRVGLGPSQLTVVALLVALGLAVTCWWIVRGDPSSAVPVSALPISAVPASPASPGVGGAEISTVPTPVETVPGPPPDGTTVTVDVAGKVRRPGIVVLDSGARVVDALKRAGGARHGVDLTPLNLARVLVDGEQIVVGVAGAAAPAPPASATGPAPGALVDLNLATQSELETLPGIGPVTAAAIITWRDEHGGFRAVTELLEVSGIGDVTLAQLTPLVTV